MVLGFDYGHWRPSKIVLWWECYPKMAYLSHSRLIRDKKKHVKKHALIEYYLT